MLLVVVLGLPFASVCAGEALEQTVRPITSGVEQRVEPLTPHAEQHVEVLDAARLQGVTGDATQSGGSRGLQSVTKVVVGVLAAAVSLGAMVVSLLFI